MQRIVFFALLLLVSACAGGNGVPARDGRGTSKRLDVSFSAHSSFIVENRYLVLPIGLDPKALLDKSSSYAGGDHLDLEVADLQTGEHRRVFGRPVALQGWSMSFAGGLGSDVLRFPGILILQARTADADGDGKLTREDPTQLYGYELTRHELFPILPENTTLLKAQSVGDALVLTLGVAERKVSIYTYSPATRQGRFIVENLSPEID